MIDQSRKNGWLGEIAAARYLRQQGYTARSLKLIKEDWGNVRRNGEPTWLTMRVAAGDTVTITSAGNGDIGQGRGRGGGCDGVADHRNVRTFSSGRNSGC